VCHADRATNHISTQTQLKPDVLSQIAPQTHQTDSITTVMEHAEIAPTTRSFWDQDKEIAATVALVTHTWTTKEVFANNVETEPRLTFKEIDALMLFAIAESFITRS